MGNNESTTVQTPVTVVNQESRRLKVRVDSDRRITNFKINVESSVKGGNVGFGSANSTEIIYAVDTSDSFAYVDAKESRPFHASGSFCYLTVCDENDVPLCINHGIPTKSIIHIKNGLISVDTDTKSDYASYAVLVSNKSNKEIRARVDFDEGQCSFERSMCVKGNKIVVSGEEIIYYRVDRQGYTVLKPGQRTVFFVKPINYDIFVSLQYIDEAGQVVDICRNYRDYQGRENERDPNKDSYVTSPLFTVKDNYNHSAGFESSRMKTCFITQYSAQREKEYLNF